MAELRCEYKQEKICFLEGHYLEALLNGTEESFLLENPIMISSVGSTKGQLKSNFLNVYKAYETLKRQPALMNTIKRCKPQKIVTGEIEGIPFKGCIDFIDLKTCNCCDIKCVKDFKRINSAEDKGYVNWYFAYRYHYQAAIYRELIRQKYGKIGSQSIIAVTKENTPDVAAFTFFEGVLDDALEIIKYFAREYNAIKQGEVEPKRCEECEYCKQTKSIVEFETIYEFE